MSEVDMSIKQTLLKTLAEAGNGYVSGAAIAEKLGVTRQTVISDKKKALLDMQTRVGRIGIWAA